MENELKIFTLGNFKVMNNDKVISEKRNINDKPWLLFKYLITEKDKIMHAEVISSDIWPNDNIKSPKHSITNLVYRLRKRFKNKKDSFVINTNGRCYFNDNTNYWLDVEEFINLTKKAKYLKRNKPMEALKTYKKALVLYKGDYLTEIPYQEWVIPHRNNYH
ncbi:MAG: winged helix-turn-helix domain-containing protein, partial [Halanaerobiales bacterium]|nr:winged helix-turn-helix domain-containing protein [Halanaerobiales bacterium]